MKLLSTKEAAKKLKYKSDARIRTLISEGKINATKVGGAWVIAEEELQNIKRIRKQYKKRTS